MYDELVERLHKRIALTTAGSPLQDDLEEAVDAIEELSAFREQITDGHFYCMRDGVLYEAKVEPPKGKVFQLPPIEFAEEGET